MFSAVVLLASLVSLAESVEPTVSLLGSGDAASSPLYVNTITFSHSATSACQNWTVPSDTTWIKFDAAGAAGGAGFYGNNNVNTIIPPSVGGRVVGNLTDVAPGTILHFYLGSVGGDGTISSVGAGGSNGGGEGGNYNSNYGGGGGGAADVRLGGVSLENRV